LRANPTTIIYRFVWFIFPGILLREQAMMETKNKIAFLIGGFHLLPFNRAQTEKIVNYLKHELQIQTVAPGHCTGHLAFKLLKDAFGKQFLYAGLGEELNF
jgi:7,8-dihydropterin-6-yl-methyl-4-(beta-D-ribofuranosyl)aminobenzene 5'-phosphate synthase